MFIKRSIRLPFVTILAGLLAACQQAGQPSESPKASAEAGPEAKPGLSLANGVLVLPVIKDRPGAAYFKLENAGDSAVSLAGAYIEGAAKAEIHETRAGSMARVENLEIGPKQTVAFERGGLHVMAFELSADLVEGATTEITLTFSDGDKLSAPLTIEKMGGGMDVAKAGVGN